MYHLPAYLALERWVLARTVVVVQPSGPEGPRRLLAAGARQVLVVGANFASEPGMDVRGSTGPRLPLRDESVDLIVCIEAFGRLRSSDRRELLRESHRALRPDGVLCVWIEQRDSQAFGRTLPGSSQLDFWSLEEHVAAVFPRVDMLAQMPWQGFSLAPILDEQTGRGSQGDDPHLSLLEDLLVDPPDASHYLAVASKSRVPSGLAKECLLIPLARSDVLGADPNANADPTGSGENDELRDELDRLREELSLRAAKVAAAHGRVRELETQLDSLRARNSEVEVGEVDRLRDALTEAETQISILRAREQEQGATLARIEDERADLVHELELVRREHDTRGASVAVVEGDLGELRRELEQLRAVEREARETLRARDTDLQILTRTAAEQDKAVERLTERLETERKALEDTRTADKALRDRLEQLDAERQELRRQTEVYVAEREGARRLAQRVEAELDVTHRRARTQEQALAAKVEEASRLGGELEGLRRRLEEADKALAQTRSRAEELSATAAQGAEQGRMLADVALDRDRLREELGQRSRRAEDLESRVWEVRETLQKERLESVRLGGEVERLREQLERSRAEETKRVKEVEQLGRELRALELEKAEANALVRVRDEQLHRNGEANIRADAQPSDELAALRAQVRERSEELTRLADQLAQTGVREEQATSQAAKRERELHEAGERLRRLQRDVDGQAALAAGLQNEVDVRQTEIEQLAAMVANLQRQLEEAKERARQHLHERDTVQRQVEEAEAAREGLRRQLRARTEEYEQLVRIRDAPPQPLELSSSTTQPDSETSPTGAVETAAPGEAGELSDADVANLPEPVHRELRRLRATVSQQADQLAKPRELGTQKSAPADAERIRRLRLEVQVRSAEQEQMLSQLDGAEQKIWEMTDASDRNAARFAASLAQLEKHKENLDALLDELEVTRNLLAAEQARAVEQERLLASERAKMARAGIGIEGFPNPNPNDHHPFTDLRDDAGPDMVDLGPPPPKSARDLDTALATMADDDDTSFAALNPPSDGVPKPIAPSRSGSLGRAARPEPARVGQDGAASSRARMTVEAVDDDDWPE